MLDRCGNSVALYSTALKGTVAVWRLLDWKLQPNTAAEVRMRATVDYNWRPFVMNYVITFHLTNICKDPNF